MMFYLEMCSINVSLQSCCFFFFVHGDNKEQPDVLSQKQNDMANTEQNPQCMLWLIFPLL